jgi:glutathione synthase/RimK-type ligase-like ATP-grasp enzyme
VIGGRAVAAMRRIGGQGWVHNVARGARCESATLEPHLAELAVRATAALGLDYAGVDLIPDPYEDARAWVLEVNGVAAWRGLQSVTDIDIAALLLDDLLSRRMLQRHCVGEGHDAA